MTRQADFTEAEWALLTDLPRLVAFGTMAADGGDAISSTRELWAGMMELAQAARARYPDNALIQDILRAVMHDEDGADVARAGWRPDGAPLGEAVVEEALATARQAPPILAARCTAQESAAYTAWVLGIARAAAEAARSGRFGVGGEQVTAREAGFVRDLATALGRP